MLQVYYCHKATIYEVALAFGWRHDQYTSLKKNVMLITENGMDLRYTHKKMG